MVETALRPRPEFSTFLLSDNNAGGDGLTLYQYKKLLRSQKVALLQHKQSLARVPGYKPAYHHYSKSTATKVDVRDSQTQTMPITESKVQGTNDEEKLKQDSGIIPPKQTSLTTRPSKFTTSHLHKNRVKSATSRTHDKSPEHCVRPKTARDALDQRLWKVSSSHLEQLVDDPIVEDIEDSRSYEPTASLESLRDETKEPNIDALVKFFAWTTSTKRAYNDVGWENKLPPTLSYPSTTAFTNTRPDAVSLRFSNKRHEVYSQEWQSLGGTWDIVQTRTGGYMRPQNKNTFCSPFRHNRQIPGYLGCTPGPSHSDHPDGYYEPTNNICSYQPKPTNISRRPNIPGYTGCTLWSNNQPVTYTNTTHFHPTTHARVYRPNPVEENISPFIRSSVLSKMISLNAPYNPFNKIEA